MPDIVLLILKIIAFIFTLAILVLSHEFGHFAAARKFGIRVLEFGFGLPPRAWGKKIGETIYSINWLPIGGFVRLFGEDETDKEILDDPSSYAAKPVLQRIGVVVAGVIMNLLLAAGIFYIVLAAKGFKEELPLIIPHNFVGVNQVNKSSVYIAEVAPGSPAEVSGLKAQDKVVSINEINIIDSKQIKELSDQNAGKEISFILVDQNLKEKQVKVIPRKNPPEGQGAIGISMAEVPIAYLEFATPFQKLTSGFVHSYNLTAYSVRIIGDLASISFQEKTTAPLEQTVSGPVGITSLAGSIMVLGIVPYLNFIGLLSLNLALVNILPFPALDGGRLVFLLFEWVTRKRVKAEVEKWVHTVGMALLIALIVLITFSDIKKFF